MFTDYKQKIDGNKDYYLKQNNIFYLQLKWTKKYSF